MQGTEVLPRPAVTSCHTPLFLFLLLTSAVHYVTQPQPIILMYSRHCAFKYGVLSLPSFGSEASDPRCKLPPPPQPPPFSLMIVVDICGWSI